MQSPADLTVGARTPSAVVLLLLGITSLSAAAAADLAIASVHRSREDARQIFVVLAKPLPPPADIATPSAWEVRVLRMGQPPLAVEITGAEPARAYATTRTVRLALREAIPADSFRVQVTLLRGNQPSAATADRADPPPPLEPADNPDDANLYFNGIVAPAAGADTLYTIDTRADLTLRRFGATGGTRLGLAGEVKTDERPHVDPDRVSLGASLERFRGYAPVLRWDAFRFELDRDAELVNLLTAASIRQTWDKPFATRRDGVLLLRWTVNLQASLGVELGGNLRNKVSLASEGGDGSGTIARLVPGVGVWIVVPSSVLDRIVFSAEYTARLLGTQELFHETRGLPDDADPVASLTRKPRHHIAASGRFMLSKWFGFEAKYEFGSVPPVFQVVDHGFSVGLTLSAKQNEAR
jgi:hypothetical protein